MILGDIGGTDAWYRPTAYRNLTYNNANDQVTYKWNQLYIGIFRANQVINQIQEADPSIFLANEKEVIEAKARFLRAFFYFQMATTYGQPVIRTTVPVSDADFNTPPSPKEEIFTTVVMRIWNLPKTIFQKSGMIKTKEE
tara:strand:+ start:415 stop:834 length:420 start_codon:yes stop_codon:yes gene_type:complete